MNEETYNRMSHEKRESYQSVFEIETVCEKLIRDKIGRNFDKKGLKKLN